MNELARRIWLGIPIVAAMVFQPNHPALSWGQSAPIDRLAFQEPPLADDSLPRSAPRQTSPFTEPADPPVPSVAVRVRVPAVGAAGKELEYRIVVDNISVAAAHHVLIRVPLPTNAKYVRAQPEAAARDQEIQWSLGTMAARARREIVLVLLPSGEGDVRCCAHVQFEHGQCVRTRLARSELKFRKEGPAKAFIYDALRYRLEVTNTGSAAATDVMVTDLLPDGLEFSDSTPSTSGDNPLTWKLGTLAAGESKKIEYQVFAKKAGSLTNRAVVTAAGGLRQEASNTVVVGEAKLTAAKTGPKRRILNRPATYQITVSNTGNLPVTGLQIVDEVPAGIAFVSASDDGRQEGGKVRWSLGALAPGARRTVQVVLRANKAGELINRATITADPRVSLVAEARTVFEGATGLTVEIEKGDDPLEIGKLGTYTVRVLNQGSAAGSGIGLTVTTTDQLKITAGRGPTMAQQAGNRLTFAPLAGLAPGAEAVFVITAQALQAGEGRLRVELTADQLAPGNPLKQEESTTIFGDNPPGIRAP